MDPGSNNRLLKFLTHSHLSSNPLFFLLWYRVSLCSPGWTGNCWHCTHKVPPDSTSRLLGPWVCGTTFGHSLIHYLINIWTRSFYTNVSLYGNSRTFYLRWFFHTLKFKKWPPLVLRLPKAILLRNVCPHTIYYFKFFLCAEPLLTSSAQTLKQTKIGIVSWPVVSNSTTNF